MSSARGLFPDITNLIESQTGISSDRTGIPGARVNSIPWGTSKGEDIFFPTSEILANNWDKVFPYRLVVVDTSKGNNPIVSGVNGAISSSPVNTRYFQNGTDYTIIQNQQTNQWIFTLPITPQQIQIVDQFAINTVATTRGILEEHNGVKFKTISIRATTGILPTRDTMGGNIKAPSSVGSIFAGTLQAVDNLNQSASRIASAFTGRSGFQSAPKATNVQTSQTGYFKARLLSNFLERYTQEKKKPQNKGWRLVLDIPKQNVSYVVTPVVFSTEQSIQSPNETFFNLQLKAWKRISINANEPTPSDRAFTLGVSDFQRILNTIGETRRVLSNSLKLLQAVRSDLQTPLNALRQTALAVKDLAGVAFTAIDMPDKIISDYRSSIQESLNIIKNSFKRDGVGQGQSSSLRFNSSFIKLENQGVKSAFIAEGLQAKESAYEGMSIDQVRAGNLGEDAAQSINIDPVNTLFENPQEFYDVLDSITIDSLNLNPDQTQRIEDEIVSASLINIDDLNRFKKELLDTALAITNNFGAGNQTYSDIYGKPNPRDRVIPFTIEESEVVTAIFEAIQAYDTLTASKAFDDLKIQNPLEYVGGLANAAEIDFQDFAGKKLFPLPFGLNIEQVAARYMKDPDKWVEIVTLNNLKPPYIDEEGFIYKLISNGNDRQINVNDNERKLFIGQRIILSSDSVPPFTRKIINLEKIADDNFLITLDGENDLDKLSITNNAKLKAFMAGTVNSQNQILIPVNESPEDDDRINTPRLFDEDRIAKISKIDWLLTEQGDLAINNAGEIQLAGGLTNLIQAMRIKLKTKRGTLLRHLDFGLGIQHGISIADIESGKLIESLNETIAGDPRFTEIQSINIRISGGELHIDMSVSFSSGSGVLPITFKI